MYWLYAVAGVIGLAMIWASAVFFYRVGFGWILTGLLAVVGVVWALIFVGAAISIWRLTQPLG
jgi:hypothetical protein